MKENFEDYEEFYISDDPQDIERERKKRNSLLSMFLCLQEVAKTVQNMS